MGETIEVGEEEDGWLEIVYSDGDVNYISAEYVEVDYDYGEAKTLEALKAEEAAKKAAEEKAKRTANLGAVAHIPIPFRALSLHRGSLARRQPVKWRQSWHLVQDPAACRRHRLQSMVRLR